MRALARLRRFFSEDPFKDAEGRFRTRWDIRENNTIPSITPHEIPEYKAKLTSKIDKKRVFDFQLPELFSSFDPPLQVWSVADGMFSINQIWVPGPILLFPNMVFQWHASRLEDIEEHHLDIVRLVQPRIEYIIIGTGKSKNIDFTEPLRQKFRMTGINLDFCPTVIYI